jgi:NarL family two-component system response regulator LiaR
MSNKVIQIMIVDDHRSVHQALADMISFVDDFELVAQGSNGQEAVMLCEEFQPDIILMDVVMPIMDGIEATRKIVQSNPNIKILALSSFQDNDSVNSMLKNGAYGYILKNASVDELEGIIRTIYKGKSVIDPTLIQQLMRWTPTKDTNEFNLTRREIEILKLISNGMSYAQVANQLTISQSTVKFHVGNILNKLTVSTRNEAIMVAAKVGII